VKNKRLLRILVATLAVLSDTAWFGGQAWCGTEKVLYSFSGSDGFLPTGTLIFDAFGNLYGTTSAGGNTKCGEGCGTVFELMPDSAGGWTESVIYTFQGGSDGYSPSSGLIADRFGNLYGTTYAGGTLWACPGGCGTVFQLTPTAAGWTKTILHAFTAGLDGANPQGGLTIDKADNLYGTTTDGGGSTVCPPRGCGTVFRLTPVSGGGWKEKVLHAFQGNGDGMDPTVGVTLDKAGNLYGTTFGDNITCGGKCGTVFELVKVGTSYTESLLYTFQGESDGEFPSSRLIIDALGNLYGTTNAGGITGCGGTGCGAVFRLTPNSGGAWSESVIYAFQPHNDAAFPGGNIILKDGSLYGTAGGGTAGLGTIFELSRNFNGDWTESLLYSFQGGTGDGVGPGGLVFDKAGNLYGTTGVGGASDKGTVFELTP
jgi:uncharacterized repeat protein (TIGR03803 family)